MRYFEKQALSPETLKKYITAAGMLSERIEKIPKGVDAIKLIKDTAKDSSTIRNSTKLFNRIMNAQSPKKIMEKAALSNNKILQALENRGYELMARNKHTEKLLNLADKLKDMDPRTSGISDVLKDISNTVYKNSDRNRKTLDFLKSITSKKRGILDNDRGRQFISNQLVPIVNSVGTISDRLKKLKSEVIVRTTRGVN